MKVLDTLIISNRVVYYLQNGRFAVAADVAGRISEFSLEEIREEESFKNLIAHWAGETMERNSFLTFRNEFLKYIDAHLRYYWSAWVSNHPYASDLREEIGPYCSSPEEAKKGGEEGRYKADYKGDVKYIFTK